MPIQGPPVGPGSEGIAPMYEIVPRFVVEVVRRQRAVGWRSVGEGGGVLGWGLMGWDEEGVGGGWRVQDRIK